MDIWIQIDAIMISRDEFLASFKEQPSVESLLIRRYILAKVKPERVQSMIEKLFHLE